MSMFWTSQTGHFNDEEIDYIQGVTLSTNEELASTIVSRSPLGALRILAELMLNGADGFVAMMMLRPEVDAHWLTYGDDPAVDERDHEYARQLRERFGS